jgi:hypothetical protein
MPLPPNFFLLIFYDLKSMSFKFGYDIFITFEMPGVAYSRAVDKIHISLQFRPSVIRVPCSVSYFLLSLIGLSKSCSTKKNSAPPDGAKCNYKNQVKLFNHVSKTLVKPFNISKFRSIDLSLFSKVRLFEFKNQLTNFPIMFLYFTLSLLGLHAHRGLWGPRLHPVR